MEPSKRYFLNRSLAAGVVLLFLVGCVSTPKPVAWTLNVTKVTPASIEVDLIGIDAMERPAWEGYDLDKYWKRGDPRRESADKLTSDLQMNSTWTISKNDAIWAKWLGRGATELLVIANLPGKFSPGPGDPRRVFIPLDKNAWQARAGTLDIQVQDTIIRVMTPQQPRK